MVNQPIEEKWKRENCGHDVMKCLTEVEHLHKEIDILADYLLKHHHKDICGSAVDTAINIISGIPNLLEQEKMKKGLEDFAILREEMDKERKRLSDELDECIEKYFRGFDCGHEGLKKEVLSIINK